MYRKVTHKHYTQHIWTKSKPSYWGEQKANISISRCGLFTGKGQFSMNYIAPYPFIYLFLNGETSVEIDDKSYTATKGDILFVFEGQHKKLHESSAQPLENYYLDLQGNAVEQILQSMGVNREQQFFHGESHELLQAIMEKIFRELETKQLNPLKQSLLSWQVLEAIQLQLPQKKEIHDDPCEEIRLLIQKDFRYSLSINEIADKFQLSRSTIFRQFKKRFGLSPKQYLEKLRLEFAYNQLSIQDISIKEIAFNSGYNSVNHFIRMFKKRYETTPLKHQRKQTFH